MVNVSGWNELMTENNLVKASYAMYNNAVASNLIVILWITFSAVLYMKTRNIGVSFFLGLLSYVVLYGLLTPAAKGIMTIILVFELAAVLYEIFWAP